MRRSMKRALWAPAVLLVASATLAACSSSGSGSGELLRVRLGEFRGLGRAEDRPQSVHRPEEPR